MKVEFERLTLRKEGDLYVISNADHELPLAAPRNMKKYEAHGNVHEGTYLQIIIDYCTRMPKSPTEDSCVLAFAQRKQPVISSGSSGLRLA